VSIVIPVFNQGAELVQCLRALERQTGNIRFEVVVVDNNSDQAIEGVTTPFPFVRYVREPKPGSYAARNRGVEASRGDLLAFTDADCVPDDRWIERGVSAMRRLPGPGMVGGRIDLTVRDPNKPTAAELYDCVFGFPQESFVKWGFAATANVFTTRAVVDQVGPFNAQMMSGGDMEWGLRVRSRGLAQAYADDVRVSHPARRTLGQLFRKIVRVAGGNQQLANQRGEGTAGLLDYAWRQLIQLRRTRANIADRRLSSLGRKLRFAAVVWLVDLLRTLERYRVHFGGAPSRT
jgi:GT2 family glycosyltransferase